MSDDPRPSREQAVTRGADACLAAGDDPASRLEGYVRQAERSLEPDVCLRHEPGGVFDVAILNGQEATYPALMAGFDAVVGWLIDHDFGVDGPAYQQYDRWMGEPDHPQNCLVVGWPLPISASR